jgi:hydrogenase maturation protease
MIKIIGVGNLLFGDEGFGVRFVQKYEKELKEKYGDRIDFIDAGTTTLPVVNEIGSVNHLFIIDAINPNKKEYIPGQIIEFERDAIFKGTKSKIKVTAHSGGVQEILATMELMNNLPEHIELIAVVPQSIDIGMSLTPLINDQLSAVKEIMIKKIDTILNKENLNRSPLCV